MGQTHNKSESVVYVNNFPTYEDNCQQENNLNPINHNEDLVPEPGYLCCVKNNKKLPNDTRWKKIMIEQLDNVDLDVWPKQLTKILKKRDTNLDAVYQADVIWAYKNQIVSTRKSALMQSVLSQVNDDSFMSDNPVKKSHIETKSILQFTEKRYADEAVRGMLDNSHILDEKFYSDNNRETWMDRSFDIKPEHAQAMNESVRKIRPPRKHTKGGSPQKTRKLPEIYNTPEKPVDYTKKHIEKYKNNTFINQIPGRQGVDEADELYQSIRKYKTVTEKIEQHLKQKQNVFLQLTCEFSNYLRKQYAPVLEKAKKREISTAAIAEYSERITTDLQQFVRIMFEGLCSYYKLDSLEQDIINDGREFLFNRDNLINFTTSLIFTNPIAELIFEFYRLEGVEVETTFQKNLKYCKKLQAQDFGVPEEYCLNETTVKYFVKEGMVPARPKSIKEAQKNSESGTFYFDFPTSIEEQKIALQNTYESSKMPVESEEDLLTELLGKYKRISQEKHPYSEAFTILSNLKHRQSPIHKIKAVVKVAEAISRCIEKFYREFDVVNTKKLDADQTLSIFLYIVARSGISDILAHCKIIERFSTNNVLNSISGYYATTLEACVNCICTMAFQEGTSLEKIGSGFKEHIQALTCGNTSIVSRRETY